MCTCATTTRFHFFFSSLHSLAIKRNQFGSWCRSQVFAPAQKTTQCTEILFHLQCDKKKANTTDKTKDTERVQV
jgi:hypothetical protein